MRNVSGRYIRTVIVIILTVCVFFSVSAYSLVKRAVYADDLFVLCSIDYVIFPICNRAFAGITAPLVTCVVLIKMKDGLYKDNYVVRSQSRDKISGIIIRNALVYAVLWTVISFVIMLAVGYGVTGYGCNYYLSNSSYAYYTGHVLDNTHIMLMIVRIIFNNWLEIYVRIMICVWLMTFLKKDWSIFVATAALMFVFPYAFFRQNITSSDRAEIIYRFYSYDNTFVVQTAFLVAVCALLCLLTNIFMRRRDFYEEK